MTDDIEQILVTSLDRRAASPVDTIQLAATAARRGRGLRHRRYAIAAASLVAVATVGAFGVTALSPRAGGGQAVGSGTPEKTRTAEPEGNDPTPPPGGWNVPQLPAASGVPGAAAAPNLVGADPGTLHFTVDGLASSESVTWETGPGVESISFDHGEWTAQITLARDPARLDTVTRSHLVEEFSWPEPETRNVTVGGVPATFYVHDGAQFDVSYLRWQPVSGVWAQVWGPDNAADAAEVASRLRLDAAYRCVLPIRIAALPSKAKLLGCKVGLTGDEVTDVKGASTRLSEAIVTVGVNDNEAKVRVTRRLGLPTTPDMSLQGHPANMTKNDRREWLIVAPDFDGVDIELSGRGAYDYPELTVIGEGITVDGDLRDPATWPTKLVG
ncbi:hypothetical protein [Micromonospora sp. KC213]|uniref:hypothetical protein n=1 Tax=Micromonospora sp. KC213 TaxID=2530378 RepID=UPI00104D3516|nr:hypothetical protein [Micromonospora sp. KC213]TDC43022.1 hypothetical protein E1166_05655 [Micromonospora sp. KC213]